MQDQIGNFNRELEYIKKESNVNTREKNIVTDVKNAFNVLIRGFDIA